MPSSKVGIFVGAGTAREGTGGEGMEEGEGGLCRGGNRESSSGESRSRAEGEEIATPRGGETPLLAFSSRNAERLQPLPRR